ncbi:hypothetical protein CHU32_13440 [Superficieibacter electus]|uniref:Copper resistance protein D n=1 Tax=Superficieibacter electus TaxID=2022662 RepID=A0A2P5GNX6_9ENTR|nr:copper homeostasis membrane protein CopD [Superficieibacter electus]POP44885.1 hypothetical protein CHU33_10515 [Superficieibacter electus]POP48272.1 hypothetical protein CHU32_13440 [Superficieibacter electus]
MLDSAWVGLRFAHFTALLLAFGCVFFSAWLAPDRVRQRIARRFRLPLYLLLALNASTALLLLMVQGGMMAGGWPDVWRPEVWWAVVGTQFGNVWLWQIVLSGLTLAIAWMRPYRNMALVLMLLCAQIVLQASVGHAAMHVGLISVIHRANQALHLLCASVWLGGLLPFLYCLRLAKGRWRHPAIYTMLRFSRYGHLAVAGVLLTGINNAWLVQGEWLSASAYGRALVLKCVLVAVMVAIALVNRYVLVPRMNRDNTRMHTFFVHMTQAEMGLGALVLAIVSLFATWEPF